MTIFAAATFDPSLGPLLAGYVRRDVGAAEVLHDAFLEHGLEPMPIVDDPTLRLEHTLALLSTAAQTNVGCASARRALAPFTKEFPNEKAPVKALAALESSDAQTLTNKEAARQDVFRAWIACGKRKGSREATRAVWAVWMLMREMPLVALRVLRVDAAEQSAQIDLVARMLGA